MEPYLETAMFNKVDVGLVSYIEKEIFPRYEKFYSHGMLHINNVVQNMMLLACYYGLDRNMAFVTACFHDCGLGQDRENHEYTSAKIMAEDEMIKEYFTPDQIEEMRMAIEDHRGSRKEPPRNMLGKCISDADRDFDIPTLAKRQLATSLKNYPEMKTFEEHFERCYEYINGRINSGGVFNLWTDNPILVQRRNTFQKKYRDKLYTKIIYESEWKLISSNGTKELILNYYVDY